MRWSTINGGDYASYYQTEAAQRENTYIQRFLWKWLRGSEVVVDYGCGTGAAKRAVVVFFRWAPNSQASWYSGRPIRFMLKARLKPWRLRRMFEREGLYLYPLNHEKAYWVAVKGPRTIREVQDG